MRGRSPGSRERQAGIIEMALGRCKTCKFWDPGGERWSPRCNLTENEDWSRSLGDTESPQAIAIDAEGYYAVLLTTEDFGCILWREK